MAGLQLLRPVPQTWAVPQAWRFPWQLGMGGGCGMSFLPRLLPLAGYQGGPCLKKIGGQIWPAL